MAYNFDYTTPIGKLHEKAVTVWNLSSDKKVLESGSVPFQFTLADLPLTVIESNNEGADLNPGPAARDTTSILEFNLWIITNKVVLENNIQRMRDELLVPMAQALYADRRLGGTINYLEVYTINWTGKGRDWPVKIVKGEGAMAGFVGVRLYVVDGQP